MGCPARRTFTPSTVMTTTIPTCLNLNNSGASNLLLGQDEISEASVVSNAYRVQYGRQAGAQVSYVTKSGTNQWHADLLFNFNNHLMKCQCQRLFH